MIERLSPPLAHLCHIVADVTGGAPCVPDPTADWPAVHRLAHQHGTIPQLHRYTVRHADLACLPEAASIAAAARSNAINSLRVAAEALRVRSLVEAAGIETIATGAPLIAVLKEVLAAIDKALEEKDRQAAQPRHIQDPRGRRAARTGGAVLQAPGLAVRRDRPMHRGSASGVETRRARSSYG